MKSNTMKIFLIETQLNSFILCSDEEIKVNDWYWDKLVSHWENVGALKMATYLMLQT